jgi:hypothetical protein
MSGQRQGRKKPAPSAQQQRGSDSLPITVKLVNPGDSKAKTAQDSARIAVENIGSGFVRRCSEAGFITFRVSGISKRGSNRDGHNSGTIRCLSEGSDISRRLSKSFSSVNFQFS